MLVKLGATLGAIALVFSFASSASAALTLGALTVTSDGSLTITTTGADSTVTVGTGRVVLSPTFSGASSRQSVEADATLDAFTGGYGAGTMGNVMGTIGAGDSIVAGLIGKYNVSDGGDSDHPQAGVIGEVGEDSAGTADAAFMAVLGGDDGALDAGAAYGVRVLNSTAGSQFGYGLDLYDAGIDSYIGVSYATADIRLQNSATISNSAAGKIVLGGLSSTQTTGDLIGLQLAPSQGADTTGEVFGAQIKPRVASGFDAATVNGLGIDSELKGPGAGDLSSDLRGINLYMGATGTGTIGGNIVGLRARLESAINPTGHAVLLLPVDNEGTQDWDGLIKFDAALGTHGMTTNSDKDGNAAAGTIKVIGSDGTLYHIQLYAD